jgi:hypothetical protein
MSVFGGKAVIFQDLSERLLLTHSGHSQIGLGILPSKFNSVVFPLPFEQGDWQWLG